MKIITVLGARPQFIKAAALSYTLRDRRNVNEVLVHTGQHYDENMSSIFFEELDLPLPKYRLEVGSGSHGAQTGRMLEKIEQVLHEERPDLVLVYGDTNSTLAGALAAAKIHIPVAHVEAGLRSFNRAMPEEINRIVTDHLAHWLFAPTKAAIANLRKEGIMDEKTHLVGDIMYDAALRFTNVDANLARFGVQPGNYVLATVHRAENTDAPARLATIFAALGEITRRVPVLMPLHPRTRAALMRGPGVDAARLHIIDPVGYLDMVRLERHARLIVTDSGGVQKEAFFHRVPCVTLRDETEWIELLELGWNRLAPPADCARLRELLNAALDEDRPPDPPGDLYGGGKASVAIAHHLGC